MEYMKVWDFGVIITFFLFAALISPIVVMVLLVHGQLSIKTGLIICTLIALLLFMSTRSFMLVLRLSPWTQNDKRPKLIGATLIGSLLYCYLPLLAGVLLTS
jgi:hypothetical protein